MAQIHIIIAIFALFGVGFAAVQPPCECTFTDELWGDQDPNVFYFCNKATNQPIQMQCATGSGFIRNGTTSGCVPFALWPTSCVNQAATAPSCTGVNVNQPSPAVNPNQYYLCPAAGQKPLLLSCNTGRGYLDGTTGSVGCAEWAQWRQAKCDCNTY